MAANTNVRFSTEAVQSAIQNFNQRQDEFNNVFNSLKACAFDLTGTWTGAASQAFEDKVRELTETLSTIENSMEGAIGKLNKAIEAYESTESERESLAKALEVGQADYV